MDRMVSDYAHCQAALRAGCVMVIQLSAAVPALLVRAGLLLPFTWNDSSERLPNAQLRDTRSIKCLSESPVFWVQQGTPPKILLGSFQDVWMLQGYS